MIPNLNKYHLTVINGSKGSGKTTLLIWMLLHDSMGLKNEYDKIYFICPTFKLCPLYAHIDLPANQIKDEYDNEFIAKLLEHQKRNNEEEVLLILDDCVGEKDFKSLDGNHPLNHLATIHRHLRISVIILGQKFSLMSTTIRANMSYAFVFYTGNRREREAIYNEIGVGSFKEFNKVLEYVFDDRHSFMFWDGNDLVFHKGFKPLSVKYNCE